MGDALLLPPKPGNAQWVNAVMRELRLEIERVSDLEILAKSARNKKLGLWSACPNTEYDPYSGIEMHR